MSMREVLRAVTASQLNEVVDAEISEHAVNTSNDGLVEWFGREYPELAEFALDLTSRFSEVKGFDEDQAALLTLSAVIALGALCSAIEARELAGEYSSSD